MFVVPEVSREESSADVNKARKANRCDEFSGALTPGSTTSDMSA